MKNTLLACLFISSLLSAQESNGTSGPLAGKNKSAKSFEICTEYMEKAGMRFKLGQIWFISGENTQDAKQLVNYTVDYSDKPFAYNFSFKNLPKEKLWLDCVYFACGDSICSSENASSDPESVYHEIKKNPVSCKSKVKMGNANRIEYFTCKY